MNKMTFRSTLRLRRPRSLVAFLALAGLCAILYWAGSRSKEVAPQGAPGLVVADEYLDFGEVWEDSAFVRVLPIENLTERTIRIVEFLRTCLCSAVEPSSLEVPTGAKSEVRVTLDLSDKRATPEKTGNVSSPAHRDGLRRDFSVQIAPRVQNVDGSSIAPVAWTIRGRVRTALSLSPRLVNFSESLVRGTPFSPRSVAVEAHTPLKRLEAECDPAKACVEVRRSGRRDDRYDLKICPRDSLPVGALKFTITLHAVTKDGSLLPRVVLPVEGRILDDIQPTPASVLFGACSLGETVHETIVLRSHSAQAFEVDRVEFASAGLTVERGKGTPDAKEFRIIQQIVKKGDQLTSIRFVLRGKNLESSVIVPLTVSYLGAVE